MVCHSAMRAEASFVSQPNLADCLLKRPRHALKQVLCLIDTVQVVRNRMHEFDASYSDFVGRVPDSSATSERSTRKGKWSDASWTSMPSVITAQVVACAANGFGTNA